MCLNFEFSSSAEREVSNFNLDLNTDASSSNYNSHATARKLPNSSELLWLTTPEQINS
jgi:hypothetical protein